MSVYLRSLSDTLIEKLNTVSIFIYLNLHAVSVFRAVDIAQFLFLKGTKRSHSKPFLSAK